MAPQLQSCHGMQEQHAAEVEARSEEERLHAEFEQDQQLQRQLDEEVQHIEEQTRAAAAPLAPQLEAARQARDSIEAEVAELR